MRTHPNTTCTSCKVESDCVIWLNRYLCRFIKRKETTIISYDRTGIHTRLPLRGHFVTNFYTPRPYDESIEWIRETGKITRSRPYGEVRMLSNDDPGGLKYELTRLYWVNSIRRDRYTSELQSTNFQVKDSPGSSYRTRKVYHTSKDDVYRIWTGSRDRQIQH